ncbi:unnamed protein product [Lampetra planeri]
MDSGGKHQTPLAACSERGAAGAAVLPLGRLPVATSGTFTPPRSPESWQDAHTKNPLLDECHSKRAATTTSSNRFPRFDEPPAPSNSSLHLFGG